MKFQIRYFIVTIILFLTEVFIGFYMHDAIIRPFGGDFLVVILLYCFVRSFFEFSVIKAAIGVLIFAYAVEVSQYFHLVNLLGWGSSRFANIIMGNFFNWTDMLMYTLGIILVLIAEAVFKLK